MSMQRRNSAYSEGVIDVNIIVPACFDNPLKKSAINFLSEVLTGKRDVDIPLSTIIGAYHIAPNSKDYSGHSFYPDASRTLHK